MNQPTVSVWRGTGYAGRELIGILLGHPLFHLTSVTSARMHGEPVVSAHPVLAGMTELAFEAPDSDAARYVDAVVFAGRHGDAAPALDRLLSDGFGGVVVDLSADFRLSDADGYAAAYGTEHPAPERLGEFEYGLPELGPAGVPTGRRIANPGCFATGLALALAPAARAGVRRFAVTALTGASGSGITPRKTTHFPDRFGSVRAYKVLEHQHLAEVRQAVPGLDIDFVPVSGPWSRGIWGTAVAPLPPGTGSKVESRYREAYAARPLVRLRDGLPELGPVVGTPFCDIGWVIRGDTLVVGFALDNLLKGAAAQAVQNLNRAFGFPETAGLLPADRALEPA